MKRLFTILFIFSICFTFSISCTNGNNPNANSGQDSNKTSLVLLTLGYQLIDTFLGTDAKPVLNNLVITSSDSSSITLAKPTLATPGNPAPQVKAFIGLSGEISELYGYIYNMKEGPVDVGKGGHKFGGLSEGTSYTIYVVASNGIGYSVQHIVQSTGGIAPVMNNLSISASDASSITLEQPTFSTVGNPTPTVKAYIGFPATISVSGSTVSDSMEGPIDVSTDGYRFSGLGIDTTFKIIVVAENINGYSVQQIVQSTAGIAPVLNSLSISGLDLTSITLAKPTLSTAGNPTPTVQAYIGLTGTISVSGSTVSGSLQGPVDVSAGGYQFSGLNAGTAYTIYVVAVNNGGYSVQQINQSTSAMAPVLNSLAISGYDTSSITIAKPTLATAGNPTPTVKAYIGLNGTISVSGSTVSNALQGPIDVFWGGYQFSSLSAATSHKVIVIAANSAGYSVQQIIQSTSGVTIAPILNDLVISSYDASSITLAKPTFSTAGSPTPTVQAYIGLSSTISVSGSTVSGSLQGPVDVSTGGKQFSGLSASTSYKVIVVAANSAGYSVQQVIQSTAGAAVAPVLNSLSISAYDSSSITIAKPTLSTAGNPTPTVRAYIGLNGTISVSGSTVSNSLQGPIDVSTGGYQFSGLSASTSYKVIVVAANSAGYSVQQIIQSTAGVTIAPVLNDLVISSYDISSITIAKPTFSTAGTPTPTVRAYIGLSSTISVSGSTVSGSLQGPIDVSTGGYQFSGLSAATSYKVIVVAANSGGYSVKEKVQSTIPAAPTGVAATDKEDAGYESGPPYCNSCNPSIGIDGVTITWSASSNVTSYNVYRSDPAYNGSGTYGSYTKINSSPVTGTSFLDDYGAWNGDPSTFRRLINVYRYKVTAVNAAGESAQSSYDEGSAQVTTAEFFIYMYDMPLRYSTEKLIYEYGGSIIFPTKRKDITGESGTGLMEWDLTLRTIIPSTVNNDVVFTNFNDYKFSQADYTVFGIYTNSIHNFPITFNGRLRAILDITGSGWTNSVNSSNNPYCDKDTTCSEPPAPYWPNPTYKQYLHVITVDDDCYGWGMLHAYTPNAGNKASEAYSWVSYRGQRPVRMDKTSLYTNYKETGCP
jgi:hypothetical protein